jgi:hypothetical protein
MVCFLTRFRSNVSDKAAMTNEECIRLFYRYLLGREADPDGLHAWSAVADREANIKVVVEHFVQSPHGLFGVPRPSACNAGGLS